MLSSVSLNFCCFFCECDCIISAMGGVTFNDDNLVITGYVVCCVLHSVLLYINGYSAVETSLLNKLQLYA